MSVHSLLKDYKLDNSLEVDSHDLPTLSCVKNFISSLAEEQHFDMSLSQAKEHFSHCEGTDWVGSYLKDFYLKKLEESGIAETSYKIESRTAE